MIRKSIALIVTLLFIGVSITSSTEPREIFGIAINGTLSSNSEDDYTNITEFDLWELLNDTSNGIQIPIDIRDRDEWRAERIDTPIPEHPRWYPFYLFCNATTLSKFLYQYYNCSVVIFGNRGYRSFIVTKILIANNFTGEIYNFPGGMDAWKKEGLPTAPGGIYNITVYETWELLNDTINGIQIPFDIRGKSVWNKGFIDTSYPEHIRFFNIDWIKNETLRQIFMQEHIGGELILYCGGGYSSLLANYELYYDNFTGTQYNMDGGFKAWKEAGLPIRNATPPILEIDGPQRVMVETIVTFTFNVTDNEEDVFWLLINWGDGSPIVYWNGPYVYGQPIKMNHSYAEKGVFNVSGKARDPYNESDWAYYKIHVPKSKNLWFKHWFDRFPKLQKILDILRLNIR